LKLRLNIAPALSVNRTTAVMLPNSASAAFNQTITIQIMKAGKTVRNEILGI
jgi:hypothetical protein